MQDVWSFDNRVGRVETILLNHGYSPQQALTLAGIFVGIWGHSGMRGLNAYLVDLDNLERMEILTDVREALKE